MEIHIFEGIIKQVEPCWKIVLNILYIFYIMRILCNSALSNFL